MVGVKGTIQHKWSQEEKEYLKDIAPGRHWNEILELMNEKFEYQFTRGQIGAAMKRCGVKTGFTGRFEKGSEPYNKGKKGLIGPNKTSFKKGQKPLNYRPIGSERVNVDGYHEIKVADPNKWRLKHRVLWEQENGPIPKGHTVIFGDGDKTNLSLDNLILINRAQLARLNKLGLIQNDVELTKTAINVIDVMMKITEVSRSEK